MKSMLVFTTVAPSRSAYLARGGPCLLPEEAAVILLQPLRWSLLKRTVCWILMITVMADSKLALQEQWSHEWDPHYHHHASYDHWMHHADGHANGWEAGSHCYDSTCGYEGAQYWELEVGIPSTSHFCLCCGLWPQYIGTLRGQVPHSRRFLQGDWLPLIPAGFGTSTIIVLKQQVQ